MSGFDAVKLAETLHRESGLPVFIAAAIDDGEDGFYINGAYEGMTVQEAECVIASLTRGLVGQIVEDGCGCEDSAARLARLRAALDALEAGGLGKPTGQTRGALQ